MGTEKILGYTIEVRGTDEQVKRQEALKRSLIDTTNQIKVLKEATKDNIEKQKEYAGTLANLETFQKAEQQALNRVTKEIIDNTTAVKHTAGSYNELSARLAILTQRWHQMSEASRENSSTGKLVQQALTETRDKLSRLDASTNLHVRNVGNYTGGILTATKGLKGFAEVGRAAASMMGLQTEGLQQVIQAGQGLVAGLRGLSQAQNASTLASKGAIVVKEGETAANAQLTISQKVLNAVRSLSIPVIGWIIGGLTALAAITVVVWEAIKGQTEAEKERTKAMDGTIIKDKELRDAYNEHLLVLREVSNTYKVINGEITEFEAALDNLKGAHELAVNQIKDDTLVKIGEAHTVWKGFMDLISGGGNVKAAELQAIAEGNKKILIENVKFADEQLKLQADTHKKNVAEQKQQMDEVDMWIYEQQQKKIADDKKANEERLKKIEANNKKIWELTIKELDKNISDAAALYKKDADNFIKEQERKNKASTAFWNKILMDAVKLAGDATEIEQARYLQERELLNLQLKNKEITQLQYNAASEIIEGTHQKNLADIKAKATDEARKVQDKIDAERIKLQEQIAGEIIDNAKRVEAALFSFQQQELDKKYGAQFEALDAASKQQNDKIDSDLSNGLISQAQADQRKKALADKLAADQLILKKKEFEDHKKLQIKQIEIATAVAVAEIWLKSLASAKSIATFGAAGAAQAALMSAFAIAASATEIAIISSQKFARGGIVEGPGTDTSDSINVQASRDEAIINAKSSRMFRPWLSAMNVAGGGRAFASGGIPLPSGISNPLSSLAAIGLDMDSFASKIVSGINNKKVYILEKEMSSAQSKADVFESQNKF